MKTFKNISFKSLLVLGTIILAYSCEKNDLTISQNDLLKKQIIGEWHSPNYRTICFNEENEFIDTSFAYFNTINKVYYVLKGKYKVENEQLKLSETELLYTIGQDSNEIYGFITKIEPLYNIDIQNDTLILEGVTILTNDSRINTDLQGTWYTESLFAAFDIDSSVTHFGGVVIEEYSIKKDTNIIDYIFTYSNSSGFLYTSEGDVGFIYENDVLTMDKWYHRSKVSFSEEKMYWTNLNLRIFPVRRNN